ncbi:MAG: exopolyphosphatase [Deltaproteobacteria bacterium]|nr:exopolyphosphatase [Deltaproteobacteria bacterium]
MRLLTRSDFDGLACAALLKEAGIIDSIQFVHPKDIQDGKVEVTKDDVLANVPFARGCGLWFDHHTSEEERLQLKFQGDSQTAPSAARVIYRYYVDKKKLDFSRLDALVEAVDKSDTAQFTQDEIENPQGWVLLSFIMDPRTGLGRFHDFRVSNYQLMVDLVDQCRTKTIEEILQNPDVAERARVYLDQNAKFRQMLKQHSHVRGNVVVLDLRDVETIWSGNRFLLYALYPQQNVSIQVMQGRDRQNIVFAVGHSVLDRTCKTDIGSLMLRYGGGGHRAVGTCQVAHEDADRVLDELVAQLNRDG